MAFNVNENNGAAKVNEAVLGQGKPVEQPAPQTPPPGNPGDVRTGSIRDLNRTLARPMGRTSAGEYLAKFVKHMNEMFSPDQEISSDSPISLDQFRVVGIDAHEANLATSAAVILLPLELPDQPNVTQVFAHTLLLEASAGTLAPRIGEWNGRRFDIVQTVGDVWDQRYLNRVQESISNLVQGQVVFHDCGVSTVPSEVDPEKDSDKLRNLAFYASAAVTTLSVEKIGYQPRFAADWLSADDRVDVSIDFGGDPIKTASGLPKRTDVALNLTATLLEKEGGNRRQGLTTVGGQLEMIYTTPQASQDTLNFGRRRDGETQHFYPVFNITTLDTQGKQITLELLTLGLASVSLLTDNLYWVNGFRPNLLKAAGGKSINLRDIGKLNLLAGGQAVDVLGGNFSDDDLLEYLGTLCHRDLAIGMHVEERGELTWVHQVILDAALDPAGTGAQILRNSFDHVTGNRFTTAHEQLAGVGAPLVVSGQNRIILGTYVDDAGNVKDLRDIDTLAMLNLAPQDPEQALLWQDTYDQTDLPMDYRLERRISMLTNRFGGGVKVKGFAQQVFFPKEVIAALAAAIRGCGIVINRVSAGVQMGSMRQRGNTMIGGLAGHNLGGSLFGFATSQGTQTQDYTRPFMGRVRQW